ncbi:lamin tail domain-containing protein [Streptomyces sp. NPDC005438]|uniref:lamin tail domain-containing protein n=1 Tax=Streptomyces sp. NPDC005438 TaxID=3156880 RepID=UPI0033BA5FFA
MFRTRAHVVTVVLATAAGSLLLTPSPAQAAGSLHLHKIYYNSPGSDRGGNASLNAEYVQIKNGTRSAFQMRGYRLKDNEGHTYTFPSYRVSAGKTVKVHTGKGTKSAGHLYQGRGWYVWNNTKDKARLFTPGGKLKDSCSYNSARRVHVMC